MNGTKTLLITAWLIVASLSTTTTASPLEDGLIAWWRMELKQGSIIPDASGNCHTLTILGSPTFEGTIVTFNDDGNLVADDSDDLDLLGAWSTSYWAREDSRDHPAGNPSNGWMGKIRNYGDAEGGWFLNSSDDIRVRASIHGSPNCSHDTEDPLSLGSWYRITSTYEAANNTLRIYLNDTLMHETVGVACSMLANVHPVFMGGYLDTDGQSIVPYCKGAMADIRIYDRTLTQAEVSELFGAGSPACTVQHEILLRSGGLPLSTGGTPWFCGACSDTDPNVLVTSSNAPAPQPALIWGGNVAPECDCGAEGQDANMLPLTTHSVSDAWGNFTTTFELPADYTSPAMLLKIRADDGAEIYLNNTYVATIDLTPVPAEPAVTQEIEIGDPGLFIAGTNTLRFYVVNTGNGQFGGPAGRGGPGDCMYVQFEARVTYLDGSIPDCNGNGVDDSCEQGVCTCLLPGDVDRNGQINNDDLHALVGLLDSAAFSEEDYCAADLSGDSVIDFADLHLLIDLVRAGLCPADLNGDGIVNAADLALLLGSWGECSN